MSRNANRGYGVLLAGVFFYTGCATTTIRTVEPDLQFHSAQIHKVMVINMGEDQALRARVEDEFVRQWEKRGVTAVASHTVLPAGTKIVRGPVAAFAKGQQYDAVLVTRLVGVQKIDSQIPGEEFEVALSTGLALGTPDYTKAVVASPQYASNYRLAEVTTRVYDVKTEKRVWSTISQTLVAQDVSKLIKPFVKTLLNTLYQTP